MSLAVWCVLAAGLMPFLFTGIAKTLGRRYDNRQPRAWQTGLEGAPARAHAAHLNAFEAFPLFAAGVFFAQQIGAAQDRVDQLALAFVLLRLGYGACYIAGWSTMRSLVWLAALVCSVALFFASPAGG
ncbi:MAG: MAPEG family protein [Xanthomonadales bacterium]|nr:MAPEG family protein [Xanthomonadales bacterium]